MAQMMKILREEGGEAAQAASRPPPSLHRGHTQRRADKSVLRNSPISAISITASIRPRASGAGQKESGQIRCWARRECPQIPADAPSPTRELLSPPRPKHGHKVGSWHEAETFPAQPPPNPPPRRSLSSPRPVPEGFRQRVPGHEGSQLHFSSRVKHEEPFGRRRNRIPTPGLRVEQPDNQAGHSGQQTAVRLPRRKAPETSG